MKEQLISFETAKLAKEKGFDWGCQDCFNEHGHSYSNGWCERLDDFFEAKNFYNSEIDSKNFGENYFTTPTQSLLQKWLREVHGINVEIRNKTSVEEGLYVENTRKTKFLTWSYVLNKRVEYTGYASYEEALEKGLQEGLKLIKL